MSMFAHVSLDHSPSALVPISGHFKTRVMAIYFTKHEAIFYPIVFFLQKSSQCTALDDQARSLILEMRMIGLIGDIFEIEPERLFFRVSH